MKGETVDGCKKSAFFAPLRHTVVETIFRAGICRGMSRNQGFFLGGAGFRPSIVSPETDHHQKWKSEPGETKKRSLQVDSGWTREAKTGRHKTGMPLNSTS